MQHFKIRAWINESDHELVKLQVEAICNANVGFGMLARIEYRHHHVVHAPMDQQRGVAAGARRLHDPRPSC